ncbi:UDP-glucose dehydrogenase family protein [Arthrobacter mangrovi]|uniref:UDP-glucose 6-dehydrogenase n=1 Tax=Arthrobacter mangrovi TaxID=2966350 RepID=A0ABQ5MV80_9MICC|nr:UDP-glucose/GDP-mannose dehydrogenase family protein [Arthrobacter mangrovi]GLB67891.1 UDP-glucose 6-dehydrogenase [Arthrobacter mangrovi]
MRITVIGTGYLGAVHAAGMAEFGHEVLGVDIDPVKIERLSQGQTTIFEPGFPELLRRNIDAGRLSFSTSLEEAAAFGDVHFICVGTPQKPGTNAADMKYIDAVIHGLAPHLHRPCLVVGKSTVPVGTARRLARLISELSPVGAEAEVAWNPEFLREGFAVQDTLQPDRLVTGTASSRAELVLKDVYSSVIDAGTPHIATDLATAELVKVSANAFLATKISFINAISEVCEAAGADIMPLAAALGHDSRIGPRFLVPGVGFGGGCLPKDIRAFMARAEELGVSEALDFLRNVDRVNTNSRHNAVDLAETMLEDSLTGKRIAVLGAAFKPNSDDVRDSPALHVAQALHERGANVRVHDPEAIDNARAAHPALNYALDIDKAIEGSELVVHLTEWPVYRQLDPVSVVGLASVPRILDARNALDIDRWRDAGWKVRAMGRPVR